MAARLVPGLVIVIVLAVGATLIADWSPIPVGAAGIALFLGIGARSAVALPAATAPGIDLAAHRLLRIGIVLLGARISLPAILDLGPLLVAIVLVTMCSSALATAGLSRLFRVPAPLSTLLVVGNAVCGNTAIAATAPVVRADGRETALAMATVTAFGAAAVLVFPALGNLTAMPALLFGVWCGVAVNDTSQVVAAASLYGVPALEIATVVKFVRNALLAVVVPLVAWTARAKGKPRRGRVLIATAIPPFVLGFLVLAILRTTGVLGPELASALSDASLWLIIAGLGAIGLRTDLKALRLGGARASVTGMGSATVIALLAWALVNVCAPLLS